MELRQGRMTSEERMNALFNYQKPDRVPLSCGGISIVNCGYTPAEAYTDPQKALQAGLWTSEQYRWDNYSFSVDHTVMGNWDFGAKMTMPESEYAMGVAVDTRGAKTEEDVWNLKLPDPKTAGAIPTRMEYARLVEKAGLLIGFSSRSPFAMAADICGLEKFARWLLRKPELCERLMEMAIDHTFNVLKYFIDTFGVEKIRVSMSSPNESNQLFSPRLIKKYALPYHKEYHKRLRALGVDGEWYFHICGEQNLNLPCLSEFAASADGWSHPIILSFGHEVDLDDAAEYFPDDIIFGNVEPAIIVAGTPQQVYEHSRICIEKGKKFPGGFFLGPGCGISPRAPGYNVWMMTKAVNDFGWYD